MMILHPLLGWLVAAGIVSYLVIRSSMKSQRARIERSKQREQCEDVMRWRDHFHQYGQSVAVAGTEVGRDLTAIGSALPYFMDCDCGQDDSGFAGGRSHFIKMASDVAAKHGVKLPADPRLAMVRLIDLAHQLMVPASH